jgi:protocatechuate 3,4-dioxygenase beta subunit
MGRRGVFISVAALITLAAFLVQVGGDAAESTSAGRAGAAAGPAPPAPPIASAPSGAAGRESTGSSVGSKAAAGSRAIGILHGKLRDQDGRAVGNGSIILRGSGLLRDSGLLRGSGAVRKETVETDGTFTAVLSPGTYRLEVDEVSLPGGFLPPWRQDRIVEAPASLPAGFYGSEIVIPEEGGERSVELRVFRASIVHGYIRGPAGEPISDALVRIQCGQEGLEGLCGDALSDERGYWAVDRVYPGPYRAQVFFPPAHPCARIARPPPPELVVAPGSSTFLEIRLERGPCSVRGKVINQDGVPIPRVEVLAFHCVEESELLPGQRPYTWNDEAARAYTDESGSYGLEGLHRSPIRIQFEPQGYEPSAKVGENKLARWSDPLSFDLRRGEKDVVAPSVTLLESRPFFLSGSIQLDPAWARTRGISLSSVVASVRSRDAETPEQTVSVSGQGDFHWACETPHEPVTLILSAAGSELLTRLVTPSAKEVQFLPIRLP